MNALGKFLETERINRNLSRRQFAHNIHTSPDTLVRMIEDSEPPTIKFLRAVSSYTGMSLLALLQMAFPDEIKQPRAEVIAWTERLDKLPQAYREVVINMIMNAPLESRDDMANESEVRKGKKGKSGGKK